MKTHVENFPHPKSNQVGEIDRSRAAREALLRLAVNSQDPCALVAIYDAYDYDLKASAVRWFGRDSEAHARAINSILVAIGQQAPTYDPQSMDVAEWIHQCVDAEARRLREVVDTAGNARLRAGRAM